MAHQPPKIDERAAPEIVQQVQELLKLYTPDFNPSIGVGPALIGIFARFSELIIERLNQVPEKNFLAFLDLLGASLLSPQMARVPLTFSLAAGSASDGLVPAGTQVAAAPAEGEKAPVIFETERELTVTAAQLTSLFVRHPSQDKYADHSFVATSDPAHGVALFLGNRDIEHVFYVGHDTLLANPGLYKLTLDFDAQEITEPDSLQVQWEIWNGTQWVPKQPETDETLKQNSQGETAHLAKAGKVIFTGLPPFIQRAVGGKEGYWLRCRLLTPITPSTEKQKGMARASLLPVIKSVTMQAKIGTAGQPVLVVEKAFFNSTQLDISKEFFPFGEKPRFGDTLYLSHDEAFSEAGSEVTIPIDLVNPFLAGSSPIPKVGASGGIQLKMEFWDGKDWIELGVTRSDVTMSEKFTDMTESLTIHGFIRFRIPKEHPPAATVVNGVKGYWIRVRIVSGNYGEDARYEPVDEKDSKKGYTLTPPTYKPPLIKQIRVSYDLIKPVAPEAVGMLAYNDFVYEYSTKAEPFKPFQPAKDTKPTLYLGFTLPPARKAFPNQKISIFNRLDEYKHGEKLIPLHPIRSRKFGKQKSTVIHRFHLTNPTPKPLVFESEVRATRWIETFNSQTITLDPGESVELSVPVTIPDDAQAGSSDQGFLSLRLRSDTTVEYDAAFETFSGAEIPSGEHTQLAWEYSSQMGWSNLQVRDESENYSRPGLLEFLAPADFAPRVEFGLNRYWLRAIWKSGQYLFDPVLHRMHLNSIMAAQAVTIKNEILGSSDASKNQKLRATRAPVLEGQRLEVREMEMPSALEQEMIRAEQGDDAISVIADSTGRPKEIWVRWREVEDFYGSERRDRHYVIDHLTGEVRFGDGLNGLIPPAGSGNIRMAYYKTGGGVVGNKPAHTITQLKTTVPYVEKVTNHEAAAGGADAETRDSLVKRAPRMIRHRGRAVTSEDFEDLALLASPEVARAKCVPLYNLAADPDATQIKPGAVSLIIVPRSPEPKPLPSVELIKNVREFLNDRQTPVAELVVVGPDYIRVEVKTEIALTSLEGANEVELAIVQTLFRFLHPLTGGLDGKGWNFGRQPHKSDLYALIERIRGVDHVRSLKVTKTEDRTGDLIEAEESDIAKSDRFMVYSGSHEIRLTV
ncbi:MAG TPA: putative baseplate assembly protein [Blastocatellia bacterium]|nr:putative baseplate assembly protein [Blastocatellia bacterium]